LTYFGKFSFKILALFTIKEFGLFKTVYGQIWLFYLGPGNPVCSFFIVPYAHMRKKVKGEKEYGRDKTSF
jgi:hypothetical protein